MNETLTKNDLELALKDAIKDLQQFVVEQEVVALRWIVMLQLLYFFALWFVLWFMLAHSTH